MIFDRQQKGLASLGFKKPKRISVESNEDQVGSFNALKLKVDPASAMFRGLLVVFLLSLSQQYLCAFVPLKISGTYIRSDVREDGSITQQFTNRFTVELTESSYRIKTVNPSPALPCLAQGDMIETTVMATGIRLPSSPGGPPSVDLKNLDKYPTVEIPEVQLGGFPGRGQEVVKVLWISYVAGHLYGSDWLKSIVEGDDYSHEVAKIGMLRKRILLGKSYGVVSNSTSELRFIQSGVLYCDPASKSQDGSTGILAPPYNNGFACLVYKVNSWSNGIPQSSSFSYNGTKFSANAKNAEDVITYTRYDLITDTLQDGEMSFGPLLCQEKVTQVKDWRALGVDPMIYKVTNSQWKALSDIPNIEKILAAKEGIVHDIMKRKSPKMFEAEKKSNTLTVIRLALLLFTTLSLGFLFFVARQKKQNKH